MGSMAPYIRLPNPEQSSAAQWRRDIKTSTQPMLTTGGLLWNAAERLADYLENSAAQLQLNRHGVKILELGSGVGWLGCVLAANLPNAHTVHCTEQAEGGALAWLEENIARNSHLPLSSLRTSTCDWRRAGTSEHTAAAASAPGACTPEQVCLAQQSGNSETEEGNTGEVPASGEDQDPFAVRWDFILGSDLVYNEDGTCLLPAVISRLASDNTCVLYCHTKRRFENMDYEFFDNLLREGLEYTEVREPWYPSPGTSPEAFTELYPDMRIAIYSIRKIALA